MDRNLFLEEILEKSYSYYSTILIYGFGESEKLLIEESVKNIKVNDKIKKDKRKTRVYDTVEVVDIFGIPYFMAFINFKDIIKEDIDFIVNFYNECEAPLTEDLINEGYSEVDFANSIIYAFNYTEGNIKTPGSFRLLDNEVLKDSNSLRLLILSIIKDLEGLGVASINSNRIYRVLKMYKMLFNDGILTKEKTDIIMYPDIVSKSMFYRDISILKEVEEGEIIYDRMLKGYRLK